MQTLGLQIDLPYLRGVLVQKGKAGIKICALHSALLKEPDNVKQLYKAKLRGRVVSGLPSKDVILRYLTLNMKGAHRHAEAALLFQSEGITHLNSAEVISVFHAIKKSFGKLEALIFTVPREVLKLHLEEFEKLQMSLDGMSASSLALVHYIRWKVPSLEDAWIVDLGSSEWACVLMEKGELKKSHALPFGTEELLAALWEERKHIPLKEREKVAKELDLRQIEPESFFSKKLFHLRQELGKALFSFSRFSPQKPIVFTGDISVFGRLREYLVDSIKDVISEEYQEGLDIEERKYAIPIGFALEQKPLQFLTQEFFPKKNWNRAGAYALILIATSFCLSAFLLCIGVYAIDLRKKETILSAQEMIKRWDPQWSVEVAMKEEESFEKWVAQVTAYDQEYSYILDVPRVAEVLAWLTQHPLLQAFQKEGDPLEMVNLQYQLVDYPQIGSAKNRYRAKVELQFRIKSPKNARRFHDALLQEEGIVDAASEVNWEATHDGYRTSFFLKQVKNPYVS